MSTLLLSSRIRQIDLLGLSDGKELLNTCYQRVSEYGKYPLYVTKEGTSAFYKRSRSQIRGDFKFQARTCLLTDRGQQYDEAPTNSIFIVRMVNDRIEISSRGIKEDYIRPFLNQPISHTVIE